MGSNILISGGGVAGLTLAYWFVSAGFTPVIVKRLRSCGPADIPQMTAESTVSPAESIRGDEPAR